MKPSVLGALLGALAGFCSVLALNVFTISSRLLSAILFPGRIFIKASNGMGPFGHMVFDTFAYLSNIVLYAAVGFAIGWLFTRKEATGKDTP